MKESEGKIQIASAGYWHKGETFKKVSKFLTSSLFFSVDYNNTKTKREDRKWHSLFWCLCCLGGLVEAVKNSEKNITLIGHSFGGFLIQHFLRDPENAQKIQKVILLAPVSCFGAWEVVKKFAQNFPWQFCKFSATLNPYHGIANMEMVRKIFFTPETDEQIVQDCFNSLQNDSFRIFLSMLFDLPIFYMKEIRENIKRYNIEIVVVAGEKDFLISPESARKTAQALSENAKLIVLPDAPHNLHLTHPEKVAKIIVGEYEG